MGSGIVRRGMVIVVLVAAFTVATRARGQRQSFVPYPNVVSTGIHVIKGIAIPGGLVNTDLIWVDEASERLYVADRTNQAVDIIDAVNNVYVGRIPGFAGPNGPTTGGGGPNGLLVTPDNKLWVGDGRSQLQVVDLASPAPRITQTISTRGVDRADELAYDPVDHVIMVGNDRETPPYATFVSTDTMRVIGETLFRDATGLEQPVWDAGLKKFLVTVPAANAYVAVVDPNTFTIDRTYPIGACTMNGLALGPFQRAMAACGFPVVLNAATGSVINTVNQIGSRSGGTTPDEIWYNSGDGQFYVAAADSATGGVAIAQIDALTGQWRANVAAPGARQVAALAANNQIFTIMRAPAAGAADTTQCPQLGIPAGSGCIAVFSH